MFRRIGDLLCCTLMRRPHEELRWRRRRREMDKKTGEMSSQGGTDRESGRGCALKFTADVEDKTHFLPWLLGSKVNLNARERRVYLDLGANAFETSIQ